MPLFFFHIHDGLDIPDRDGTELADEAQARLEAVRFAGRSIAEMGMHFWTQEGNWSLEVTDDCGATLFALTLLGTGGLVKRAPALMA